MTIKKTPVKWQFHARNVTDDEKVTNHGNIKWSQGIFPKPYDTHCLKAEDNVFELRAGKRHSRIKEQVQRLRVGKDFSCPRNKIKDMPLMSFKLGNEVMWFHVFMSLPGKEISECSSGMAVGE